MTAAKASPEVRARLARVAGATLASRAHSPSAMWVAEATVDFWPSRSSPRAVRLIRREDASDEAWAGVKGKLDQAIAELAAIGAPVRLEWRDTDALLFVDGAMESLW